MKQVVELKVLPAEAANEQQLRARAAKKCQIPNAAVADFQLLRRSIDARGSRPFVRIRASISTKQESAEPSLLSSFQDVSDRPSVLIIGAGPAGYFAALELIELGWKPIVLDRGKSVKERISDIRAVQRFGQVNPNSNYCFGEGGAGTYSDGKLYTRSHKRGNIEKILRLLVEHGAQSDILIDAHPHIGSNKLPKIVANIKASILAYGGEVHFGKKVTDFILHKDKVKGVIVNEQETYYADALVLATGHSARDIYRILDQKKIAMEAKPFALGVRIEHPQALIDEIQYNQKPREEHLPASSYKLVSQVKGRGVFSFCMCPGGLIVPASTAPGEIVVNGMSLSKRDSPFANSGTVVGIEKEDLKAYSDRFGVFASVEFQKSVEQKIFQNGNGSQQAPAQRLN
ncbi:MAG: FAD-dependent protein, partial [Bacteroidota bacterium]